MKRARVEELLERERRLKAARATWEHHWQAIAEVMRTERADFTVERPPGERRNERVFDGTAQQAVRGLAAALDGMLKGKQSQWFRMRPDDEDLADDDEVRAWLRHVERRMWRALYDDSAHFIERSAETDLDLVTFGTGILFVEEIPSRGLNFRSFHLRDTVVAESNLGDIDTVLRSFSYTARQAAQQFGEKRIGAKTREALGGATLGASSPDSRFRFLHAVMPRQEYDPRASGARGMPFASIWIDVESEHLVGEGGFHEMPYAVPRWETVTGEVYGRSPAMVALADVETVNEISRTLLKAGQKAVDPPLLVAQEGLVSNVRLFPGGINYVDYSNVPSGQRPIDPLVTGANMPLGLEMENQRRDAIWAAFFRNVLQLPVDAPDMTATEVLQRREEFLRVIGPTFARLEAGYIAPVVNRVFGLLLRAGVFREPPEVLRGRDVSFEFESPATRAQKVIEANANRAALEQVAPFLQLDPGVADNIDGDRALRLIFEANGAEGLLRSPQTVARIRQGRVNMEERAALVSAVERGAGVAERLARIPNGQ